MYDIRDNNSYTVRKLADGNCWMVDSLNLINKSISSVDSNLPANKTVVVPASSASLWCQNDTAACDNQLMTLTDSTHPEYGTYYNWYTATATYGTYEKTSGETTYSICPKGWKLPSGIVSSSDWWKLYDQYHTSSAGDKGPNLLLNGFVQISFTMQGTRGYYWSSTASSSANAGNNTMMGTSVNPNTANQKWVGMAVRCVAQ